VEKARTPDLPNFGVSVMKPSWSEQIENLQRLGPWASNFVQHERPGRSRQVTGSRISPSLIPCRSAPVAGRAFLRREGNRAERGAIIRRARCDAAIGSEPSLVGSTLTSTASRTTVVRHDSAARRSVSDRGDIWISAHDRSRPRDPAESRQSRSSEVEAGVTPTQHTAEMETVASRVASSIRSEGLGDPT